MNEQKDNGKTIYYEEIMSRHIEESDLLLDISTSDEIWSFPYDSETRRQSVDF